MSEPRPQNDVGLQFRRITAN